MTINEGSDEEGYENQKENSKIPLKFEDLKLPTKSETKRAPL
jgi:hypothetical protein